MLVADSTSSDDEDIAEAVTMRSEELTLAHHVVVGEVFAVLVCVTETVSVMDRELRAPHVILLRVSVRSWLRQPLCQSSATPLRREGSFSFCVYTSIFHLLRGLAHATMQDSVRVDSAPPFVEWRHFSVVYAPFKRLGSVTGRDVTISVRKRLSAPKMPRCSRATVWISLFFCGAFPRQRSGGPCCRRSLRLLNPIVMECPLSRMARQMVLQTLPTPCLCLVPVDFARRDSSVRHPPMPARLGKDESRMFVVQTWAEQ